MLVPIVDFIGTLLDYTTMILRNWWPAVILFVVAWFAPPWPGLFARVRDGADAIAQKRVRCAALVAALAIAWSGTSWLARGGVSHPPMHDDYAVLIGAQMLAKGVAAYPTHPLWRHFEQVHVLHVPKFASKYPIGNQLVLALGIVTSGVPIAGSLIVTALACAAIFWALLAALPARWALAGAALAATHPVILSWSQAYRGGGLSALGGALLVGATLRIAREPNVRNGALAGAGLGLLAMSRPFEGLVLAAGCAAGLLVHAKTISLFPRLRAFASSAAMSVAVAAIALAGIAVHNRAVTGSFTTLPWMEYSRQYDFTPTFVWQEARRMPTYQNAEFRYVYNREYRAQFKKISAPGGLLKEFDRKLYFMFGVLVGDPEIRWPQVHGVFYLLPLVLLPLAFFGDLAARIAAVAAVVFACAPLSLFGNLQTHYLSPAAALTTLLMTILLRAVASRRRGVWIAVAIAIIFIARGISFHGTTQPTFETARLRLVSLAGPGRHLFIVAPEAIEVLYNTPDIDRQRVVWARDLGDNRALRAYYADRTHWRVEDPSRRGLEAAGPGYQVLRRLEDAKAAQ